MQKIPESIPKDGFYKVHVDYRDDLSPHQRVQLIRKGNELFKAGDIELAKKLFLTLRYTDGIIRVGDLYYNSGKAIEALEMYRLAHAQDKVDLLIFRFSKIIKQWIKNDN